MKVFVLALELAATLVFAASGALTGLKKNMDIFGVCILGLTTAVGGGVIRDLILGNTPPVTFQNPVYAMTAIGTSLVIFLPSVRRVLNRDPVLFERFLFLMDTVGLSLFTVMGIRIARGCMAKPGLFLLVFVGVITGVGGGVLRDIMAGNTPYIFVKHVYASASLVGALTAALLWDVVGEIPAMLTGATIIFVIRCLSAYFKWNLPKAKD